MIDSFDAEDAEEQRETLTLLQKVVDEDRPGRRRVFSLGTNPPASGDMPLSDP